MPMKLYIIIPLFLLLAACKKDANPVDNTDNEAQTLTVNIPAEVTIVQDSTALIDIVVIHNSGTEEEINCTVSNMPADMTYKYFITENSDSVIHGTLRLTEKNASIGNHEVAVRLTNSSGLEHEHALKVHVVRSNICYKFLAGKYKDANSGGEYIIKTGYSFNRITLNHPSLSIPVHMYTNCETKTLRISDRTAPSGVGTSSIIYEGLGSFNGQDNIKLELTTRNTIQDPNTGKSITIWSHTDKLNLNRIN